ncbi:polypyrimidine tract-binding protein homolog 2 isoform X1 [Tanacetum coccineum]
MGVPLKDGMGHKIERMKVEYEWKPPVCTDCHIFGHSNSQCPKRAPVEVVADVNEPTHDGFTVVTKRRKRSKAKENNNAKPFEGLRLGKSKSTMVWTKKTNTTDGTNKVDDNNLKDLKNQFFTLQDQDDVGESSNENGNVKDLDADDLDSEVEVVLESPMNTNVQKGARTPSVESLNVVKLDMVQHALDTNPMDTNLKDEEAVYLNAFNEAKLDEERFLKQKAKMEWLEAGDSNSSYFHKTVKARNQYCRIEEFLGNHSVCDDLNIDGLFHSKVSDQSCLSMVRDITNNEIKNAMFNIGDDRAPSPYGYTSTFFKKGWDVVGDAVCNAVRDFFFNDLYPVVTLYINVLVKSSQTGSLRALKRWNRGPPRCALKVDIQKAYDTVNWHFLEKILLCFGFPSIMVQWIKACVTSASYSISINGNIHGFFRGKRGIRQGDPLSPYLFTLVMEVFTMILKRRVLDSDSFRYHKHCEEMDIINLCFADDLFMFARGDVNSSRVIMEALDEFKLTSGLVPSIPKSTTYFCNVSNNVKISILQMLPFSEAKVAWEVICLPKNEGGLRIQNLDVFNVALMTTHIWNIISHKDSLWVSWIHQFKLRGEPIIQWMWPQAWLLKAPNLSTIPTPNIDPSKRDMDFWRDLDGSLLVFFLRTQDKLRQWDVGESMDLSLLRCPLCNLIPDLHEHLFFAYFFSSQVWHYVRSMADMDLIPPTLH